MPNDAELDRLHAEYLTMLRLEGLTPQARGRGLNKLIANLLRCWGIKVLDSVNTGPNEIDVTFRVDRDRYILEAKWQEKPVSIGSVDKLQGMITRRASGVFSVFLSMSGYSRHALESVLKGRRLELVHFEREHLEAMLTGELLPSDW